MYYFIILIIFIAYLLHRTQYGNWIYASGGDPVAARATGVPVANVKISLFMISTSLACLLGILTVMTSGASDPKAGDFREFHAIAAAVIGVLNGANIVRAHDVKETVDALKITNKAQFDGNIQYFNNLSWFNNFVASLTF